MATGVAHGRRGVLLAAAGMNAGNMAWYLLSATGLSALAATYPGVFLVLRWLGVAYLAWLAGGKIWRAWRGGASAPVLRQATPRPFREGLLVQLSNPKALIFVTAVLPPFIAADRPVLPQIALFGLGVAVMDALAMTAYGFGGAAFAARMAEPRFARRFSLATGLLLLAAAALIIAR